MHLCRVTHCQTISFPWPLPLSGPSLEGEVMFLFGVSVSPSLPKVLTRGKLGTALFRARGVEIKWKKLP